MRLASARIRNYRSIFDTGEFEIEQSKTILVGPNEAGKTAILRALQQINPPKGVKGFEALRDYPRSLYSDISTGKVNPKDVTIVQGTFVLEDRDKADLPLDFHDCTLTVGRTLANEHWCRLNGGPSIPAFGSIKKDLLRLDAHVASRRPEPTEGKKPIPALSSITAGWHDEDQVSGDKAKALYQWLETIYPFIDENNSSEEDRYDRLVNACNIAAEREKVRNLLYKRLPVFVYYNNYFRVRPALHLGRFAARLEAGTLDDELYDYGNACLLKLLGFSAKELSELGKEETLKADTVEALEGYRKKKDERDYRLNAASIYLTKEIKKIWNPDDSRGEAAVIQLKADGQYLKAVVVDSLGVEVELDQRSEGLQWLVSFFIVFFAETQDQHKNAILLLDEPGLSLHALKQPEFRSTLTRLSENNQTLYTTHSPFLVGPDELDLVRVVEMPDRQIGTRVHTTITAGDPAAILPLQEALGYDMAQSLFTQKKNLILEGLTDYWYVEAIASLLRDANICNLDQTIALIPANAASKVVYYATILHAQDLKVAALLDSDAAGENAAKQDTLVHTLGQKRILRTKDCYSGQVKACEIEDLLRETLIKVAKESLKIDVAQVASTQPERPIVDIFSAADSSFSKYKLAKAFIRWSRDQNADALTERERTDCSKLIAAINKALK